LNGLDRRLSALDFIFHRRESVGDGFERRLHWLTATGKVAHRARKLIEQRRALALEEAKLTLDGGDALGFVRLPGGAAHHGSCRALGIVKHILHVSLLVIWGHLGVI
jgi:hypothetical protein